MLGRFLYNSDLEWFLKTLDYNRTRILQPGDYFAFRPLHMFILSLNDILFRYDLIAQGIANCALFSATATALFCLAQRISGSIFLAFSVTALWAFQLAGSEILLWQHISPYILLPGFFCAALLLLSAHEAGKTKFIIAGICVFLASLTHETGGLAAVCIAVFSYSYGVGNRKKYAWPFALGGITALSINILDYFFIHHVKSFTGPGDTVGSISYAAVYESFLPFTGAIGIASLLPSSVEVFYMDNWYMIWNFLAVHHSTILIGAVFIISIIAVTATQTFISLRKYGTSPLNLAAIFALTLFGMLFVISEFRIFTRGPSYMAGASYYFSLFSLSISIMVLVIIVRLNSKHLTIILSSALCLLSAWHIHVLYSELSSSRPEKNTDYNVIKQSREKLLHNNAFCFGGIVLTTVPTKYSMWTPLYQDVACSQRSGALPVYLTGVDGRPALSLLNYSEGDLQYASLPLQTGNNSKYLINGVPFGHTIEVTLEKTSSPEFLMTNQAGDQFGFLIKYNMIYNVFNDKKQLSNSVLWNPGAFQTTYKIAFFQNKIVLFADGILIGLLDDVNTLDDEPMIFEINSEADATVNISRAIISTRPDKANVSFDPKYVFDLDSGML